MNGRVLQDCIACERPAGNHKHQKRPKQLRLQSSTGYLQQTALERQDLPCTYLAHLEPESVSITVIVVTVVMNIISSNVCSRQHILWQQCNCFKKLYSKTSSLWCDGAKRPSRISCLSPYCSPIPRAAVGAMTVMLSPQKAG